MVVQLGGGLAAMAAVRWGISGSSKEDKTRSWVMGR
jgi:hypothetical protein